MERNFRQDRLTQIGEGVETPVFSMQRILDGKERSIVLKTYEYFEDDEKPEMTSDKNGFNDAVKQDLERKHTLLKKAFGPYIPGFRVIKNSDCEEERYFAVQKKIDLPADPDIFDFFPEDFEDDGYTTQDESKANANTRRQLLDFADRLKKQLAQFESENPDDAIILDIYMGENNIVLDKQGDIHYLDITANTAADGPGWKRDKYIQRIQQMELLAGRSQEEIDDEHL